MPVTLLAGWQWRPTGHLRLVAAPCIAIGPMVGDIKADVIGTGDHAWTWAYGLTMSYGARVEAWWESADRRNGVGLMAGYEVQRASFSYRLRDTAGADAYSQAYDRRVDMDGWWWSLAYLHAF